MFANVRSNVCDMSSPDTVAKSVTLAREGASLSKAELARRIGVTRSLITEIEAGTRKATDYNLQKIADVTGCDLSVLIAR